MSTFGISSAPELVMVGEQFYIYLYAGEDQQDASAHCDVLSTGQPAVTAKPGGPIYTGPRVKTADPDEADEGMGSATNFTFGPFQFKEAAAGRTWTFYFQLLVNGIPTESCECDVTVN
jgi:hypothetical protein